MIAGSDPGNYGSIGPDLDHLSHSCNPVLSSFGHGSDPAAFNDHSWLASFFTPDGTTVYALTRMEYHGHEHDPRCTQGYFGCWWNSVAAVKSTDGGVTFAGLPPPNQLVATFPYPYIANHDAVGYAKPSNIVVKDGAYYALLLMYGGNSGRYRDQPGGMCLARSDNLEDPASWRGWDGSDFTVRFVNPYTEPDANPAEHICSPVSPQQLNPRMTASLTFNTYLNRWLLVDDNEGGLFSSVSSDLVTWSPRQLFLSSGILNSYACGDPDR